MKYRLCLCHRWKILENGLLNDLPQDTPWGIRLGSCFLTRNNAIFEYAKCLEEEKNVPSSLILIEEHFKDLDWFEG